MLVCNVVHCKNKVNSFRCKHCLLFNPKFLLIVIYFSLFPSLIDLPVNLTKCQVRTGTANPFGAL
jgi:hypothetical protein